MSRDAIRGFGLAVSFAVLVLVMLASLWIGTKDIPFTDTWRLLFADDGTGDAALVRAVRVPRALLGVLAGAALGLAGALMQSLTRNPLADPGLLGVNMGAAAAIVTAIAFFGVTHPTGYVWFALVGAAIAATACYVLGASGRSTPTPDRLVLSGAALTSVLYAYVSGVLLLFPHAFDSFRFWNVGSLAGRTFEIIGQTAPFILPGVLITFLLAKSLTVLALGDEAGRALGAHAGRTRAFGILSITLMAGAATAAVGPIGFVGLTVPHVARMIGGTDQRWVLAYSAVLAPILLLVGDVVGRVVIAPQEMEVGIVTAFLGAPVFIALCRRRKLASL
ncbi:iron chelate uptake ABC transporter family permease subunit [Saccharothrix violaceirubra]|uniref:Iron complex transport system permease protein n=1 Tax=Saccharothrix violaceirubra TaxID=413306 RepID=A0A7W7T1D5_9PSEU|nr:iron chelate uptake ABC transporter family permease subunit [Saccharothrix violaceirubra]MBB4964777.1 iron complex transport system permease protein [Saccharothrix violaceirubra]